mgnify:CR=1 FL=1
MRFRNGELLLIRVLYSEAKINSMTWNEIYLNIRNPIIYLTIIFSLASCGDRDRFAPEPIAIELKDFGIITGISLCESARVQRRFDMEVNNLPNYWNIYVINFNNEYCLSKFLDDLKTNSIGFSTFEKNGRLNYVGSFKHSKGGYVMYQIGDRAVSMTIDKFEI